MGFGQKSPFVSLTSKVVCFLCVNPFGAVAEHSCPSICVRGEPTERDQRQAKSTCRRRQLSSKRVAGQTRWAGLHRAPRRHPRAVDHHVEFSAAAGVAAYDVVLVEIDLAGVHHFPAWREAGQTIEYSSKRRYLILSCCCYLCISCTVHARHFVFALHVSLFGYFVYLGVFFCV